jgi:hypothetical protein
MPGLARQPRLAVPAEAMVAGATFAAFALAQAHGLLVVQLTAATLVAAAPHGA